MIHWFYCFELRYNKKTYKIDEIDWVHNPLSKFKKSDGSETTFAEYFLNVSFLNANLVLSVNTSALFSPTCTQVGENTAY
jgi:hypothetical protein